VNVRTLVSRPTRALARAVAVAATVAALGTAGTVGASAATPAPSGAVVVKEVRTADGVLTVYRSAEPLQAAANRSATGSVLQPRTGSACYGADPKVCFTVNGSGYYVSTMVNSTYYGSSASADIQIKNPSGGIVARSSFFASGGNWYSVSYSPYTYVAGGWWCGFSNANGSTYTGSCINVTN
jgi:hypothetical protein